MPMPPHVCCNSPTDNFHASVAGMSIDGSDSYEWEDSLMDFNNNSL